MEYGSLFPSWLWNCQSDSHQTGSPTRVKGAGLFRLSSSHEICGYGRVFLFRQLEHFEGGLLRVWALREGCKWLLLNQTRSYICSYGTFWFVYNNSVGIRCILDGKCGRDLQLFHYWCKQRKCFANVNKRKCNLEMKHWKT